MYFPEVYPALAEADARGIRLMVHVHIEGKEVILPDAVLWQMLNLLLDEAIKNLTYVKEPVLYLLMHEETQLDIEVAYTTADTRNYIRFWKYLSAFFHRTMVFCLWKWRYHLEYKALTIKFRGRDCICNLIRIPYR